MGWGWGEGGQVNGKGANGSECNRLKLKQPIHCCCKQVQLTLRGGAEGWGEGGEGGGGTAQTTKVKKRLTRDSRLF